MRTLILDNYDSFSHILFQYLWEVNGEEPVFVHNDEWTLERIRAGNFDNIVISPGPGHPAHRRDFGVCGDVLCADLGLPILGVCLGMQGIGLYAGARVVGAPAPRHGKPSRISHDGSGLFAGLPRDFTAIRYHSLAVDPGSVPSCLSVTAVAEDDGQIMGLRRQDRPLFGVQFHPESIGTAHGKRLLANFRDLTLEAREVRDARESRAASSAGTVTHARPEGVPTGSDGSGAVAGIPPRVPASMAAAAAASGGESAPGLPSQAPRLLEARALPWRDPEAAFARWFLGAPAGFWLDSLAEPVPGERRISYMGSGDRLYASKHGRCGAFSAARERERGGLAGADGTAWEAELAAADPFGFLAEALGGSVSCTLPPETGYPGNFRGGLAGYFGYGLKHAAGMGGAAGRSAAASAPVGADEAAPAGGSGPGAAADADGYGPDLPDALFVRPDRMLAFDAEGRKVWAFLPCGPEGPGREALEWLARVAVEWDDLPGGPESGGELPSIAPLAPLASLAPLTPSPRPPTWRMSASREEYLGSIRCLQDAILRGETYEACLTNELRARSGADPWEVYRLLRRLNPAPYAAFFRFPGHDVLCASPERFLKLAADGRLECRPIKGTRPRGADAAADAAGREELAGAEKDRAENLMIVDLVRNDFGKVCAVGSVEAPDLMRVEPHPTVWQLVSTVIGRLKPGLGPLDAVRACFPGGSMTGAPKSRTIELLEAAERRSRGIFSGALGYLGQDGAMDLGMVIRTLVRVGDEYRIGCGGAILAESDPGAEWAEAMLKAQAPMRALEAAEGARWKSEARIG